MTPEVRNRVALTMLVLAKIVGVLGLVVPNRSLGAALLILDGLLLAGAVALCILNGRKLVQAEDAQRDMLAQMVREGTLDLFVREARQKAQQANETPSTRLLPDEAPVVSSLRH